MSKILFVTTLFYICSLLDNSPAAHKTLIRYLKSPQSNHISPPDVKNLSKPSKISIKIIDREMIVLTDEEIDFNDYKVTMIVSEGDDEFKNIFSHQLSSKYFLRSGEDQAFANEILKKSNFIEFYLKITIEDENGFYLESEVFGPFTFFCYLSNDKGRVVVRFSEHF